MALSLQNLQTHGIFHSLPTFPEHDGRKFSAIVTGTNGISGAQLVEVLSQVPNRWGKIFALSRKPPTTKRTNVYSIAADFLNSGPEEITKILKDNGLEA